MLLLRRRRSLLIFGISVFFVTLWCLFMFDPMEYSNNGEKLNSIDRQLHRLQSHFDRKAKPQQVYDQSKKYLLAEDGIFWSNFISDHMNEMFISDRKFLSTIVHLEELNIASLRPAGQCFNESDMYLQFVDGSDGCAVDRPFHAIMNLVHVQYLARLLHIPNIPPMAASFVGFHNAETQWSRVRQNIEDRYKWPEGKVTLLTRPRREHLRPATLPTILRRAMQFGIPLANADPNFSKLSITEAALLAQWVDFLLLNYLLGNHVNLEQVMEEDPQESAVAFYLSDSNQLVFWNQMFMHPYVGGEVNPTERRILEHALMSSCLFRREFVSAVERDVPALVEQSAMANDPELAKLSRWIDDRIVSLLGERLKHVRDWIAKCRQVLTD